MQEKSVEKVPNNQNRKESRSENVETIRINMSFAFYKRGVGLAKGAPRMLQQPNRKEIIEFHCSTHFVTGVRFTYTCYRLSYLDFLFGATFANQQIIGFHCSTHFVTGVRFTYTCYRVSYLGFVFETTFANQQIIGFHCSTHFVTDVRFA